MKLQNKLWFLGLVALVKLEGVLGVFLFLLLLTAWLLWAVYQWAYILVPAVVLAVLVLVLAFLPLHLWARGTIEVRARRRILHCLETIRLREGLRVPRAEIRQLEQRLREAAQALADRLYQRRREAHPASRQRSRTKHALERELEDLRLSYGVVPQRKLWDRFVRLHLESPWLRWLIEHPGPGRVLVTALLAVVTTAMVRLLQGSS